MSVRLKKNQGFSLTEVVVAMGLIGVLALILIQAIKHGELGARGVRNMQNVADGTTELRSYFWNPNTCTGNLQGTVIGLGQSIPVSAIKNYDENMVPAASNAFELNTSLSKFHTVQVTNLSVLPTQKISTTSFLAEVRVDFQTLGDSFGPGSYRRTFPLSINVEAASSTLVQCGAFDGLPTQDRICELASNGANYYDPVSETCKSKFNTQCFPGDHDTAMCGPGWNLVSVRSYAHKECMVIGDDASPPVITRDFGDYGVLETEAPPYSFKANDTMTGGNCYWATDVDNSTWKCGVMCQQQVVF